MNQIELDWLCLSIGFFIGVLTTLFIERII